MTAVTYVTQRWVDIGTMFTRRAVGLMLNPNAYGRFVVVLLVIQFSMVLGRHDRGGGPGSPLAGSTYSRCSSALC
jgi:hypothetical protein